ncbi:hypothetical protein N2152v2_009277 [Parachlorella kessleri]
MARAASKCDGSLYQEALASSLRHSGSPPLSAFGSGSLDSSFPLSRRPSLDLPDLPALSVRACAKQLNLRLMHACSPARIAKLCDSQAHAQKEAVLSSPVFLAMAELLVGECSAGHFNAQSTSVAWWAVSKLICASHPIASQLFLALEAALLGCLAMPIESERPNSQAVSSIWYAWGRLDSYLPSNTVLQLMWERTLALALTFDTQGAANSLWALGMLKKKHGDAFVIRTDVLSALSFLCQRMMPSFQVQIGHHVFGKPEAQVLLAAFDIQTGSLPPPLKSQELHTLFHSMQKCGYKPSCFRLPTYGQENGCHPPMRWAASSGYSRQSASNVPHTFQQAPFTDLRNVQAYPQTLERAGTAAAGPCGPMPVSPFAAFMGGAAFNDTSSSCGAGPCPGQAGPFPSRSLACPSLQFSMEHSAPCALAPLASGPPASSERPHVDASQEELNAILVALRLVKLQRDMAAVF